MTLEPQESSLQRKLSIACKPNLRMPIRCDTAEKRLPVSVRLECQQRVDGHSEKNKTAARGLAEVLTVWEAEGLCGVGRGMEDCFRCGG